MTEAVEGKGGAGADLGSGEAMHVHRPKPLHGWREVLLEIGVIVVGIVIAVGLEQTVEFLHHSHQREQLTVALRRDGEANRKYIKEDIAETQAVLDWALEQASALERAGPSGPLTLRRMPRGYIGSPDAGVWPSAKASGVTNLLPASAQNWLEYLAQAYDETFESSASAARQLYSDYAALDQVIIGQAKATASGDIDLSTLTAAQRSTAVERLRAIAECARTVMRQLLVYDAGNDFILSVPLDQLDTPEAAIRYSQIYREKMETHPAANYAFGGV
jgi:hypothetical protein